MLLRAALWAAAIAAAAARAAQPLWPAGEAAGLQFAEVPSLSDEFGARDAHKWDFGGDRDVATGCARWAGPAPLYLADDPGLTDVARGRLLVRLRLVPPAWFAAREYACVRDPASPRFRWCNWDANYTHVACGRETDDGNIAFDDWICRRAPFCLPAGQTTHHSMVAGQVVSRAHFRYGYMETRVKASHPDSNTVSAAWMGREYWDPDFSRIHPVTGRWEAASSIRQRHWQEIDVAELFMTRAASLHGDKFIPNVHLFADYDGRHTSTTGRGPVIHDKHIAGALHNEMHWDPGPVYTHNETWHDGWNSFAVWWDAAEIRFIVNGRERARYRNRYIHQSQHIKFSLLSNLEWFGVLPARSDVFQIDYVRVWDVSVPPAIAARPESIPGSLPLNDDMGVAAPPSVRWPPAPDEEPLANSVPPPHDRAQDVH